jgi:DNA processing protein
VGFAGQEGAGSLPAAVLTEVAWQVAAGRDVAAGTAESPTAQVRLDCQAQVAAGRPTSLNTQARLDWQAAAIRALDIYPMQVAKLPLALQASRPLPTILYVRGNPNLLLRQGIAIVGSRRASPGPLAWAKKIAQAAAEAGQLILSGGAVGVDAAAHQAALAAGQPTVAYLGTAIDQIYPAVHRTLFARLLAGGGALISEHPPGAPTQPYHHAARNRLIAAHASVLYVAEAAARSGTLGTATFARRQKRPLFVPPAEVGGQRAGIEGLLAAGYAQVHPCQAVAS